MQSGSEEKIHNPVAKWPTSQKTEGPQLSGDSALPTGDPQNNPTIPTPFRHLAHPRTKPHAQSPRRHLVGHRQNHRRHRPPPTENTTRTGTRLDSNLSHADEWAQVARKLGRTTDDEYFSVPRGRVLLDLDSLTGIILHGPATKPKRLALIAQRFGLAKWRAELDQHYFTGEDADRLFADDAP